MKEKEDEDARLKSQAKRLDYITRALRIEEMPVLRKKYEAQVRKLLNVYQCATEERLSVTRGFYQITTTRHQRILSFMTWLRYIPSQSLFLNFLSLA